MNFQKSYLAFRLRFPTGRLVDVVDVDVMGEEARSADRFNELQLKGNGAMKSAAATTTPFVKGRQTRSHEASNDCYFVILWWSFSLTRLTSFGLQR